MTNNFGDTAERLELSWLVTVRWTTLAACVLALLFGQTALGAPVWDALSVVPLLGIAISNLWLYRAAKDGRARLFAAGVLVSADVIVLAGCLLVSGGVLNPASIFLLVEIVLAALALGRPWLWIVTILAIAGYGVQLLAPTSELAAAQAMHPQISEHVRGMWWAFVATALIISVLVARLASAIERRDRTLLQLREDANRQTRLMGLASLAAGAAHELSTPLGTIAVAAGELARTAETLPNAENLLADINLIRAELVRARGILTDFSGRADGAGRELETTTVGEVIDRVLARASSPIARVKVRGDIGLSVRWPLDLVARALGNVIRNGLRAAGAGPIEIEIERAGDDRVAISIVDRGTGMSADVLARAGEPFFTTQPPGEGTGLGLFVAGATANQIGGLMTVRSTPGEGTTVTFTLPRHQDAGGPFS